MNTQAIEKTSPLPASSKTASCNSASASQDIAQRRGAWRLYELGHGPVVRHDLIARLEDTSAFSVRLPRRAGSAWNAAAVVMPTRRRPTCFWTETAAMWACWKWQMPGSYPFWAGLTDALKTGRPQNEVKRGHFLRRSLLGPRPARPLPKAMTGMSVGSATAIAKMFPWAKYRTFADIGAAW